MKYVIKSALICLLVLLSDSCKHDAEDGKPDLTIAFGSCNNQILENHLWDDVIQLHPEVWIWGGDIVYADTENMDSLRMAYDVVLKDSVYNKLAATTKIFGTWDDHDYGLGDGGEHFLAKKESQQVFLDFLDVPEDDERRQQEGVYYSENIETKKGTVRIISLDTRYFRSDLTFSKDPGKRYQPNNYGEGTLLGELQWQWLEQELKTSKADFNVINSSIQVLSNKHGYEYWANFPHEVDRLEQLIVDSKAKGVILLSGDRHISEFSKETLPELNYPLIDFTSSGLTHVYEDFPGEPNPFRFGNVVTEMSFGVLEFDFKSRNVTMKMIGDQGKIFQEITQGY